MIREAKDYLKAQIKKGVLTNDVFSDKSSTFNKLKDLLKNSPGYVGYFTRAHYKDPENVTYDRLVEFYKNLKILREYKAAVDISKYSKTPFDELEKFVQYQVNIKTGFSLPGIYVNKDPRFKQLQEVIKNYNWEIIIAANEKDKSKKPQPDISVVRAWGCPKWCIKRKNYFYNTYVKNEQHVQYILIQKDFAKDVEQASLKGKDASTEEMFSPINYGENWDRADSYPHHSRNTANLRFGMTTKPSENLSFFNQRENLTAFNDTNSSVSNIDKLSNLMDGFPIRRLDIEVRKALGLQRSEFDISVPSFEEIIKHIDLSDNERDAEIIANACGKFVQIMDKLHSKVDDFENISREIAPYFMNHKRLLDLMMYALLYAKDIPDELIERGREMYEDEEKAKKVNMVVTISLIQIYLDNIKKGIKINEKLEKVIRKSVIKDFIIYYLTRSLIRDRPKSNIDFKRAMIIVYKTNNLYQEIEGPGSQVTRSKLFKLIANYLYSHDKEYGEQIMREQGWLDEIEFINIILDKKNRNNTENTEFLSRTVRNILRILPDVMSDKVDDRRITPTYTEIFDELKMYDDDQFEYSYINHVEALFTSLSYYIKEIEPRIIKEFK